MIPLTLIAGDTLDFTDAFADYPATDGWTLKYLLAARFTTPTQASITITAATYETYDYRVQEAPATTAAWAPGVYTWSRWVEKSGARHGLGTGELRLLADQSALAQGTDQRGHARKVLEAIEAVLERRATMDQESYAIGGRTLARMSVGDLMRFRQRYVAEAANEDAATRLAQGLGGGRKIQVRL